VQIGQNMYVIFRSVNPIQNTIPLFYNAPNIAVQFLVMFRWQGIFSPIGAEYDVV
jgi:hypothetical protein